jgi:phospholipase C
MPTVDHLIVLALENRSFDHMLGFLQHPDPMFDGVAAASAFSNPNVPGATPETVTVSDDALPVLPVGPAHSHEEVMRQLALRRHGRKLQPTNQGFVGSYDRTCRQAGATDRGGNSGALIMRCQPPSSVPVLSTLALEFAVCTRWFCSVPGETWPNRNFMHAATSDGETNISPRFFFDHTIFEVLSDHGKTWHIYHGDTPQTWAFPALWDLEARHASWYPLADFAQHVAENRLPHYSFLEPNHGVVPLLGDEETSNSQHPENNTVEWERYDRSAPADGNTDFRRGERLVAHVYEILRANPAVFERSLLLITYDEHGGFYDHVPPPTGVPAPKDPRGFIARIVDLFRRRRKPRFDFTTLGPRVPTVIVSPYVPAGTIETRLHDHASIPATARALFVPQAPPLTARDGWATPFNTVLTLDTPRSAEQLPNLSEHGRDVSPQSLSGSTRTDPAADAAGRLRLHGHLKDFANQADRVHRTLVEVGEPEAGGVDRSRDAAPAADASRVFTEAATRHRRDTHQE